jgi:hypothetical protein
MVVVNYLRLSLAAVASAPASAPSAVSAPASVPAATPCAIAAPSTTAERIVLAAERYLGREYVFGGRDGRNGCREGRRRVRCLDGIDCQSLIFFAFESVTGRPWTRFSVQPSVSIRRGELGRPVAGLDGVRRTALRPELLLRGDVLFFLLEGYNLDADVPLLVVESERYGTWHTGIVHCRDGATVRVIHARPGDRVVIEPLDAIAFDALFAVRLDSERSRPAQSQPATTTP